jgi:hypothetical protein
MLERRIIIWEMVKESFTYCPLHRTLVLIILKADLNVSATPFDLNQGAFFPTPGTPYNPGPGSNYGNDIQDVFGGGSDWNGGNEMWYLPPGAAFFQNVNDQGVTQTAEGVNVGGMDLLDFMALDPFPSVDGSGF